jgi:hypothetical protein
VYVYIALGDIKLTEALTGKIVYFYHEANTKHTTYPNGKEIYEFPNGQVKIANNCI